MTIEVVTLALRLFREDQGIQADPERYPGLWREYLAKAANILELQEEDDDA